jgi:hypothetical protein
MDAVKAALVGSGVAGFGIVSAFVGSLINQRMSRNTQREQWLRDKRYEDYQVVLSAITSAYMAMTRVDKASFTSLYTEDMARELEAIKANAFRVLHDRIFIAEELRNAETMKKWLSVVNSYGQPGQHLTSEGAMTALTAELAEMALSGECPR